MTSGFLALALLGPAAPTEGLQTGDELKFVGTVDEAVDRPGNRFRRSQSLVVRVLVLEQTNAWTDAAVLTLLTRADDPVTGAVAAVTGGAPDKTNPPGVRLDLVRVYADGTARLLLPAGAPSLARDDKTPVRTLPVPPLDSFAPFEFGMFPPRPPKVAADKPWAVASADASRPAETWQVQGTDLVTAERCALLVMNQAHPNWTTPVGGKLAWHRADATWVARDGIAHKVHRVIKHRDGTASELAAWVEVKYELTSQTSVNGRLRERYLRDVELAFTTAADMAPLFPDARRHAARFEKEIKRLDLYLADVDSTSPYRDAVLAVRRQIDAARRGEAVSQVAPAGWLSSAALPKRTAWPEPGSLAPDFTAGSFRLADARGKPVVLVFFKPGSETTDLALAVADALYQKYGARSNVVPLAVWGDLAAGVKDRDRRKLAVPVYDGTQAETAFGVDSVPRFVVLDGSGTVRWTFTGVGAETGHSARTQLERLLPAAAPGAPPGIIRTPAPGTAPSVPRP